MPQRLTRPNVKAFTLIEVLVGMILLASLAVAILHGFRSHRLQQRYAEQRILAVAELDRMLIAWSGIPSGIPLPASGLVAPDRSWVWTTRVSEQRAVLGRSTRVVRVEVFESAQPMARRLAFVDVLQGIQ